MGSDTEYFSLCQKGQDWGGTIRGTPFFLFPSGTHTLTHVSLVKSYPASSCWPNFYRLTNEQPVDSTREKIGNRRPCVVRIRPSIPHVSHTTNSATSPLCIFLHISHVVFQDSLLLSQSVIGVALGEQLLPSARRNLLVLIKDKSCFPTLLVIYLSRLPLAQCLIL